MYIVDAHIFMLIVYSLRPHDFYVFSLEHEAVDGVDAAVLQGLGDVAAGICVPALVDNVDAPVLLASRAVSAKNLCANCGQRGRRAAARFERDTSTARGDF